MATLTLSSIPLKDVGLFKGLPPDEIRLLRQILREESYDKGDILFYEGKPCERIFIIQTGRVKVFRTSASGREQILEILGPGDTCACNPGATPWCCSSTTQALTPCRIWVLARHHYERLIHTNAQFIHTLNQLFAKRLCRFSSLIEDVSLNDAQKRLIRFLLDMQDKETAQPDQGDVIFVPFTREEIAHRIGSTRETVTRHLYQLKRSRLISLKPQHVIIRNKSGLQKLLC